MSSKMYTGINIQWPISELITEGTKTVETRTYPIPSHLLGKELILIETPGKKGKFKSRMTAIIKITNCFQYKDEKDFYLDMDRHLVSPNSLWEWKDEKPKWAWELKVIEKLPNIEMKGQKGIVYTKNIMLPSLLKSSSHLEQIPQ